MKILLRLENKEDLKMIIRRFGYALIFDRRSARESFVRRLGSAYYPRFHLYIEEEDNLVSLNLHLDQKQASYKGQHAHSAEYDGDLVEAEIAALRQHLLSYNLDLVNMKKNNNEKKVELVKDLDTKKGREAVLNEIEKGDLDRDLNNFEQQGLNKKKSFWSFFK